MRSVVSCRVQFSFRTCAWFSSTHSPHACPMSMPLNHEKLGLMFSPWSAQAYKNHASLFSVMEFGGCSSSSFCLQRTLGPLAGLATTTTCCVSTRDWRSKRTASIQSFSVSYHKFVDFALDETTRHTQFFFFPSLYLYFGLCLFSGIWIVLGMVN